MTRITFVLVVFILVACGNKKKGTTDEGFSFDEFSGLFRQVNPPFALSDTGLAKNKDTTVIRSPEFASFISDSLQTKLFGKESKPRYIAMVHMKGSKGTSYYLVKAISGSKKIALLMAFNKDEFGDVLPFLVPDNDPSTSQLSSID